MRTTSTGYHRPHDHQTISVGRDALWAVRGMSGSLDGDEAPYSSSLEGQVLPSCPNGLFSFGEDCLQVLDADEEVSPLDPSHHRVQEH